MEELSDGKRITRNEKGQFEKVELDRELARAMQVKSVEAQKTSGSKQLLREAGYELGTEPEHLKVLAEIAASKRSGSVAALRDFRSITQGAKQVQSKASEKHKIQQVGGSNWLVKLDGVLYRRIGAEAAELARMIKDQDGLADQDKPQAPAAARRAEPAHGG